jgi:cytochrome c oxidase cbb3-type subunit 3
MQNGKFKIVKSILALLSLLLIQSPLFAAGDVNRNPVYISMLVIIVVLAIVIAFFSQVVIAAIRYKYGSKKEEDTAPNSSIKNILVLFVFLSSAVAVQAQKLNPGAVDTASANSATSIQGIDAMEFYTMAGFILLEVFIIFMLALYSMRLLGVKLWSRKAAGEKVIRVKKRSLVDKLNASVSIEKEKDILLDHNYDGIQELDNDLPPWWKYGFYLTIIVAIVYMVHFHITKTGKLQTAEYEEQLAVAQEQYEEYKKHAGDLVDENSVTLLTDNASLAEGKAIFMINCSPCHGKSGEGVVGPNLTDEYWLHKGGIKDIFRTIKLGWPEKGMKSWQQDLSPKQIQLVASYIKSLKGTKPANAKDKQGELYAEESAAK